MTLGSRIRLAACLFAATLIGCQPESPPSASRPSSPTGSAVVIPSVSPSEEALALPPPAEAQLAAIFDPMLERYGLRLSRAALLNTAAPYEESETGRFLGLYVEPTGAYDETDYLENLVPVAREMITLAFDRWPGLEAVDVCQEPPAELDDSEVPPPETQLQVSREASDALAWEGLDLAGLIAAARDEDPPGIVLRVSARLADEPLWEEALDSAAAAQPD